MGSNDLMPARGLVPFLSSLGAFFTGAASGPGGVGSVFTGLGSLGQQMQYNRALQNQAVIDAYRRLDNAAMVKGATGMDVTGAGDVKDYAQFIDPIRQNNQNPYTNQMLAGGMLQISPYGSLDPSIVNNYTDQQGKVTNANAAMQGFLPDISGQGQNASVTGAPSITDGLNLLQMATGQDGRNLGQPGQAQPLQAGLSATGPGRSYSPVDFTRSPYGQFSGVDPQIAQIYGAGMEDKQRAGTLAETTRSNQATEANTRYNYEQTAQHYQRQDQVERDRLSEQIKQGFYRNSPSAMSDLRRAREEGLITDDEYRQQLLNTKNNAPATIQGKLADMLIDIEGTKDFDKQQKKISQYNSLAQRYGMDPFYTPTPFGGDAQQNINTKAQQIKSPSQWKSERR